MQVSTEFLTTCEARLDVLASDVNPAVKYTMSFLSDYSRWGDGRLVGIATGSHSAFLEATESSLDATKRLLSTTGDTLHSIALRYDATDADQFVSFRDLIKDLDPTVATPAITASTSPRSGAVDLPSDGLAHPEGMPGINPVFLAILQWPDYLSFSWWIRYLINEGLQLVMPGFAGGDIFEWLWSQIGGDWDKVYAAGDAFGHIGKYFDRLAATTEAEAVAMFQGWTEGEAAAAAGEFFAELVAAFAAQAEPYADLADKYEKAAGASYMLCQAAYSGLDALGDHLIALQLGVGSIGEAFAAFFTGGTTTPLAIASAVAAFIAELSAVWGSAVAALMATGGVLNLLQASSMTITTIPLPEP
jgi:hypothetical protein